MCSKQIVPGEICIVFYFSVMSHRVTSENLESQPYTFSIPAAQQKISSGIFFQY